MWIFGFLVQLPPVVFHREKSLGNHPGVHLGVDPGPSFPLHPGGTQGCAQILGFKLGKCSLNSLFPVGLFLGWLFVPKGGFEAGITWEVIPWPLIYGRVLLESPSLLPEESLEFQWGFVPVLGPTSTPIPILILSLLCQVNPFPIFAFPDSCQDFKWNFFFRCALGRKGKEGFWGSLGIIWVFVSLLDLFPETHP